MGARILLPAAAEGFEHGDGGDEALAFDLCGEERYLKTTLYGLTAHAPDFAILAVRADQPVITSGGGGSNSGGGGSSASSGSGGGSGGSGSGGGGGNGNGGR